MLTDPNIEAELSYAYLHAVASKAGFSCEYRNRHLDGACIDATITEDGRKLADDSLLTSFSVDVQLKATCQNLPDANARFSYSLSVAHYDKLRNGEIASPRVLVVLRLPTNAQDWLQISEDALVAKRCAYWVSLRGAGPSMNQTSQTVHLPRANVLSHQGLTTLMTRFSRQEEIPYVA
jgi:hypothetical protein